MRHIFDPIAASGHLLLEPAVAMQLAENYQSAGRLAEAESVLREILAGHSGYDPAWHALGLLAFRVGNLPAAIELIVKAAELNPGLALYHRNLGELCRRLGRLQDAVLAGRRASTLAPEDAEAWFNLGLALADSGDPEEAKSAYQQVLQLNPDHGYAWNNLGAVLMQAGSESAAAEAHEAAVRINPGHAEALCNLGALYSVRGRLEEARALLTAALHAAPSFVEAHFNLSPLKTYSTDDPELAHLETLRGDAPRMPQLTRARYWFALGKALEDCKRHDEAFLAYAEGNRTQQAVLHCDEAWDDQHLQELTHLIDAGFFTKLSAIHEIVANRVPVFIVGMPRSGTTLLEQILASNPGVYGAGELGVLDELLRGILGEAALSYPSGLASLSDAELAALGSDYLDRVWALSPEATHIVDKMPANFFHIGLIHRALPQAKILHITRNPLDTCFSCYARLFTEPVNFAYDLGTLGRYYRRYMILMQHWQQTLPADTILDVRYEDLIGDTESQAQRVMSYLGLPWDPVCLNFHANTRPVRTASLAQVRQPIYTSSVERWRPYEKHLAPLISALGEFAPV